jgi:hypothetical protein
LPSTTGRRALLSFRRTDSKALAEQTAKLFFYQLLMAIHSCCQVFLLGVHCCRPVKASSKMSRRDWFNVTVDWEMCSHHYTASGKGAYIASHQMIKTSMGLAYEYY